MNWNILNKEEWHKIEEDMGVVTDIEFEFPKEGELVTVLRYKSNGVEKAIYFSGNGIPPILVQSFLYCSRQFTFYNSKQKPLP